MSEPYKSFVCLGFTLDPVHVGTGGYRLGRVDNTIIREPGTNLPKIPGSSLAGVARAMTALAVQSENHLRDKYLRSDGTSCAGKGGKEGDDHCGQPDCEVCTAFGFSKKNQGFQGLVQFSDARILLFPVASMVGPLWVTCPSTLMEAEVSARASNGDFYFKPHDWSLLDFQRSSIGQTIPDHVCHTRSSCVSDNINLGWLYLKTEHDDASISGGTSLKPMPAPSEWSLSSGCFSFSSLPYPEILNRVVIVSDCIFHRIVNDNLEVRTSVAINPATGAAEDGALFSYEAIPRATVLAFTITVSNPANYRIPLGKEHKLIGKPDEPATIDWIWGNLEKSFPLFEALGVGGMNTRGMGRIRIHRKPKEG
jgi:CRISPR-associated protein Cmr4